MNTAALTTLRNKASQGFTLIELLVVIGILGVLAAALLATLDPLEQIRKGQDSNRQSVAVEVVQGFNRYYANKTQFPWEDTSCTGTSAGAAYDLSNDCIADLIAAGELKTSFSNLPTIVATGTNRVQFSYDSTGIVSACFVPASKAQQSNKKFNATGGTGTTHVCFR